MAAPVPSGSVGMVVAFARAQVGKPYRMGAAGPAAWDCSGLIMGAFARVGVRLPHSAAQIGRMGVAVPRAQLQPGDVLYWPIGRGHVALYIGNGLVVHASRAGQPVKVAPLWGSPSARRLT